MKNNVVLKGSQALEPDSILKASALLYLQEALADQAYENCQELINTAKELGATSNEISDVIADFLRGGKPGGSNGENISKSRSRF